MNEILVSIIFILSAAFLLFGLKNITYIYSPIYNSGIRILGPERYGSEKYHRKIGITEIIINKWRTRKKALIISILFVLTLCIYLLSGNFVFSLFISICLGIYIFDLLNSLEEKRKDLLNNQLIEFLNNMAVMLKAGNTIRTVFKSSAGLFKEPLGTYLRETAAELELNFTFDEALDRFSRRCGSREAGLLASSLKINNKIGGDLIPIIDNVAESIRYNLKLKSKIRTMSIQSRFSGSIISIFPVIVLILMCIFKKESVIGYFSTGIGIVLLIIGGVMEITGIIIIKKITCIGR
jgi:tight adherence protein B